MPSLSVHSRGDFFLKTFYDLKNYQFAISYLVLLNYTGTSHEKRISWSFLGPRMAQSLGPSVTKIFLEKGLLVPQNSVHMGAG